MTFGEIPEGLELETVEIKEVVVVGVSFNSIGDLDYIGLRVTSIEDHQAALALRNPEEICYEPIR